MSELHRIKSLTDPWYERFQNIYSVSFPLFEQRNEKQQEYALGYDHYYLECGIENQTILYFVAYWDYKDYIYIEHFAVNPDCRGLNIGTVALQNMVREKKKLILLEIDPLNTELALKRYRFYRKLGFVENDYPHFHPPYDHRFPAHELLVLSLEKPLEKSLYEKFYRDLCDEIMKIS